MVVQPTIEDLLEVVYRRKWPALLVAAVIAACGTAFLMTSVPRYRSEASLIVRFGQAAGPTTNLARDSALNYSDTNERRELIGAHSDILTSPGLAAAVIDKVGLAALYPDIAADPPQLGTPMDAAVKRFEGDLFVSPELTGDVIRVAFTTTRPAIARETLQAVIEAYLKRESEIFSDTNYAFQKQQSEIAFQRLETAQHDLVTFKAEAGLSDFDTQMNALIRQRSDLASRLQAANVALTEATQRRSALESLLATVAPAISSSSGAKYSQIDDAQSRLNALLSSEREMTATHGADWPAARALRASIAEARASMAAMTAASGSRSDTRPSEVYQNVQTDLLRVTAEAQSNREAVALMTRQAAELDGQIATLEARRAGLAQRQRELDLADSTYRNIVLHLEDSRIGADKARDGLSRIAVIAQPSLPYSPSAPRYKLLALATAAAAGLAGLFVAFTLEYFDDRFRSAKQVTGRLNVPVLATFDKG